MGLVNSFGIGYCFFPLASFCAAGPAVDLLETSEVAEEKGDLVE